MGGKVIGRVFIVRVSLATFSFNTFSLTLIIFIISKTTITLLIYQV